MKGFVNIIKPLGLSSSALVVRVRGILSRAAGEMQKTGHLGTLDPMATGVLPIAVGNATRLFDMMLQKQKTYVATFKFGMTTDTLDSAGKITIVDKNAEFTEEQIVNAAQAMVGVQLQVPPQYSAKSVGGKRAYDIARAGGEVQLAPKNIELYSISQLSCEDWINKSKGLIEGKTRLEEGEFAFEICCSAGTYIRAIARDMATMLGTVGYMTSLVRTTSGCFSLNNAVTFEQFEGNPLEYLLPTETFTGAFARFDLPKNCAERALNGVKIDCDMPSGEPIAVYNSGEIVAIGEVLRGKLSLNIRL